jgi:hypothetical protein
MKIPIASFLFWVALAVRATPLPEPSAGHLPKWRGFNLLEKFGGRNEAFQEDDFRMIAELGFNFVRLPMDYRGWIANGDWRTFREETLREIDQAVEYGRRYDVHVCLNFHRAPGYTVASPPEAKSLWTDPEAQEVCALHWATFARRYKGVPNRNLSFNLLNEPAGVDATTHERVIRRLVEAIRKEDPDRLIICDARDYGSAPALELTDLKVAQATRGYKPMSVSHFRAEWVGGSDTVQPAWPGLNTAGWLAGPQKRDLMAPLRIEGPFPGVKEVRLKVQTVSTRSRLVAKADGRVFFDRLFVCGGGTGEWKRAEHRPEWNIYQNVYDRDYTAALPPGTKVLEIGNTEGDWMTLSKIGLVRTEGGEDVLALQPEYGMMAVPITYHAGAATPFSTEGPAGREWIHEHAIRPFLDLSSKGVGVMVGEFGAYNRTPHPVVLRWMEDCLAEWDKAGWGWALWNFRGSFGILDSGRTDVAYESYQGHLLDRKMLELLQRHRGSGPDG